jgi:hypothetical protein
MRAALMTHRAAHSLAQIRCHGSPAHALSNQLKLWLGESAAVIADHKYLQT